MRSCRGRAAERARHDRNELAATHYAHAIEAASVKIRVGGARDDKADLPCRTPGGAAGAAGSDRGRMTAPCRVRAAPLDAVGRMPITYRRVAMPTLAQAALAALLPRARRPIV